jgi:hypothetical protein
MYSGKPSFEEYFKELTDIEFGSKKANQEKTISLFDE